MNGNLGFIREIVAAGLTAIGVSVVALLALRGDATAIGAMIGVVGAAVAWYLRGRVQEPKP